MSEEADKQASQLLPKEKPRHPKIEVKNVENSRVFFFFLGLSETALESDHAALLHVCNSAKEMRDACTTGTVVSFMFILQRRLRYCLAC